MEIHQVEPRFRVDELSIGLVHCRNIVSFGGCIFRRYYLQKSRIKFHTLNNQWVSFGIFLRVFGSNSNPYQMCILSRSIKF